MEEEILGVIGDELDLVDDMELDSSLFERIDNKVNEQNDLIKMENYRLELLRILKEAKGMNIEKALTAPINANTCVDHLGNTFQSERKMCQFYNVNIATYRTRINNGLSVKDALTLEIRC